ncbi:MAG: hypothetical protein H7256_14340 [Bdellovibrio sp.]|nr:hypothetical protein [Bdellovibrio sp.]
MKNNIHQIAFWTLLCFTVVSSAGNVKRDLASVGIKSKEAVKFYDKGEIAFSDTGKINEYQGVLVRLDEPNTSYANLDLYLFPNEPKIAMSSDLCQQYLSKLFGAAQERILKVEKTLQIYKSHTGPTCEFILADPQSHSLVPFRYVIAGFLNARLTVLAWQLREPLMAANKEKLRQFWDGLR